MSECPGYGKVWSVGHRAAVNIFSAPVYVQEKVDGSQFSFGRIDGEIVMRSKGQPLHNAADNKMFTPACEHVLSVADSIPDGVVFRAETLFRPKHNTLASDRVPLNHIALFDVEYLDPRVEIADPMEHIRHWAFTLNVDAVPCFDHKTIVSAEQLREFFENDSFLGGQKIEGVVCKRYDVWDTFGSPLRAKFVSEAFKEVHVKDWKGRNPGNKDILTELGEMFRSEARWQKAVQHMREAGTLDESPRDIGPLIKAVTEDVLEECKEEIAERLFQWGWRAGVGRAVTLGLPEWYKARLMEQAFDAADEAELDAHEGVLV